VIDLLAVAIGAVVAVLMAGAVLAVSGAEPNGVVARILPPAIALLVYVGYFAALEQRGTLERPTQGTLGKAAFKLAVVGLDDERMRPAQAVLRQLAKLALFPLAVIMPKGRAPHDWAAGSRVVRRLTK
jgi:uncharacterized RDD family membrane protein YckC